MPNWVFVIMACVALAGAGAAFESNARETDPKPEVPAWLQQKIEGLSAEQRLCENAKSISRQLRASRFVPLKMQSIESTTARLTVDYANRDGGTRFHTVSTQSGPRGTSKGSRC